MLRGSENESAVMTCLKSLHLFHALVDFGLLPVTDMAYFVAPPDCVAAFHMQRIPHRSSKPTSRFGTDINGTHFLLVTVEIKSGITAGRLSEFINYALTT